MILGGKPRPRPLAEQLDKAIAAENALAVREVDPVERAARAAEDAERWQAIRAAQDAAGHHAVVLPIAVARDALDFLREHPETDGLVDLFELRDPHRPAVPLDTLIRMIEAAFPDRLEL